MYHSSPVSRWHIKSMFLTPFYWRTDTSLNLAQPLSRASVFLVTPVITYCFPLGSVWSNTPGHKPLLIPLYYGELSTKSLQDIFPKIKLNKTDGLILCHLNLIIIKEVDSPNVGKGGMKMKKGKGKRAMGWWGCFYHQGQKRNCEGKERGG